MKTLQLKYGVVSTDEHIQEAPEVWTSRMSKAKFGEDIPHVAEQPDGSQAWLIAGELGRADRWKLGAVGAAMIPKDTYPRRWDDVPKSTYVPSERLKVMDAEEVDTHTFFPNIAGITNEKFQKKGSVEFRLACIQAYNNWLAEEWTEYSPRFISQCIVPMWDAALASAEISRAVDRGHKGVVWHGAPEVLGLPFFNDRSWDPVYQACSDLAVPLCLHLGAIPPSLAAWPGYAVNTRRALGTTRVISGQLEVLANVLFSGVLDRFPKLKVIMVESGVGWIPFLTEIADHQYDLLKVKADGLKTRPSEAFKRQVYCSFWFEPLGDRRYSVGIDNILYETDFPHPTSTYPNSKWCREESLKGVPPEERKKLLMDNAIKLYGLNV